MRASFSQDMQMKKAPTKDLGVPKDPRVTQGQEGHVGFILCITLHCRLSAKQVGSYPSNHQLHFLAAYPGSAKRFAFSMERSWVAAGKSFMGTPALSCLCVRQVTPSWKKCWLKVSGPHWRAGQGATPVQMVPAVIFWFCFSGTNDSAFIRNFKDREDMHLWDYIFSCMSHFKYIVGNLRKAESGQRVCRIGCLGKGVRKNKRKVNVPWIFS